MKIKLDYVTNSSSSAFLIFIPKNYDLNKEIIQQSSEYKDYIEDEEPSEKDVNKMIQTLIDDINLLKKGEEVIVGPYGWDALILIDCLEEHGLVLKKIDVDGEGASTISPVKIEDLSVFISKVENYENKT